MTSPISAALTTVGAGIFAGGKTSTAHSGSQRTVGHISHRGGITNTSKTLEGRATHTPTQLNYTPPLNTVIAPHDRMHTPDREQVISLASLAYATSGHPFWARQRIREEDEVTRWDLAV